MTDNIFLIQEDGKLIEMHKERYDSEDLLQRLLIDYPDLLAGGQINSDSPRKWLLIDREAGVPDEEGGSGRWSIDHLFIDQDAIPTLVEVKRSSDTRIRREVVGQMLDYASNAVVYWPIEELRYKFEGNCQAEGIDPEEIIGRLIDDELTADEFWDLARLNLQAGKIRMLFVADQIPNELKRIVEFLNEQMSPAEVLAIEIGQYVGQGLQTLVPRVVGQTEEAKGKKSVSRPSKQWDEASFMDEITRNSGSDAAKIAKEVLEWGKSKKLSNTWGRGKFIGSFILYITHIKGRISIVNVSTDGKVWTQFGSFKHYPPFNEVSNLKEAIKRFNRIKGINITDEVFTKNIYPHFPISILFNEDILKSYLEVNEWLIDKLS